MEEEDLEQGELEQGIVVSEQDLRILKALTENESFANDFISRFEKNIFMYDAKEFGEYILAYYRKYKKPPTKRIILESVKDASLREKFNDIYSSLEETSYSLQEIEYDLDKLKNRFIISKIQSVKANISEVSDLSEAKNAVKLLKSELKEIESVESNIKLFTRKSLADYIPDFKYIYNQKIIDKNYGRGILTHYSFLDHVKNGMSGSEMLIIGGETGAGKSMFLNNLAIQMWLQGADPDLSKVGHNVLYFSLEMPFEQCFRRTLARIANVPMYEMRDAKLSRHDFESVNKTFNFLQKYPYRFEIIDTPRGTSVDLIEKVFLEAKSSFNPEIVVVDYLGLLDDDEVGGEDWLKLGKIAGKLHEFARVYNVVVLTAVQLNRPAQKANKDPSDLVGIHRIGRSSNILHHANIGIQIETRGNQESLMSDLIYHIIKNRDGDQGKHFLIKNFRNASLRDPEVPYTPPVDLTPLEFGNEDITPLLSKYGWNK